jgi:hypothetical protein
MAAAAARRRTPGADPDRSCEAPLAVPIRDSDVPWLERNGRDSQIGGLDSASCLVSACFWPTSRVGPGATRELRSAPGR